jgi:hypothetical protein
LRSREGYQSLQQTVVDLSAIMVSKRAENLNPAQKEQLKALFGHSAVLQRLRHKLLEAEEAARRADDRVVRAMKLSRQWEDVVLYLWDKV